MSALDKDLLSQFAAGLAPWARKEGAERDVVLSSRVRLARNVAGLPFTTRADAEQRSLVLQRVHELVGQCESLRGARYYDCEALNAGELELLAERFLVSREFAGGGGQRAVVLSNDESLSIMVNEEDHLRMQVLAAGLDLEGAAAAVERLEHEIGQRVQFAFSDQLGYLTACPTNLGTAMRASLLLHLPGLVLTGRLREALDAVSKARISLRGWHGEGTELAGDLLQMSNRVSLGVAEEEILRETKEAAALLVEGERRAREELAGPKRMLLEDRVAKAEGMVSRARLFTLEEGLRELSYLRLGALLGVSDGLQPVRVEELTLLSQPAHLRLVFSLDESCSQETLAAARADLMRQRLAL